MLQKARECGLCWQLAAQLSEKEVSQKLFPHSSDKPAYKTSDYEYVHREMAKSGVTLSLLWVEYCEKCHETGEIPYKSTQFYKYYSDFVDKTKATMHINRKPGEIMEVDWAGQTVGIVDSDTGEIIEVYIFVAALLQLVRGQCSVLDGLSVQFRRSGCSVVNGHSVFPERNMQKWTIIKI